MVKLNDKQKELLKGIIQNNASFGAFTGMIFNAVLSTNKPVDELIGLALDIKIEALNMANAQDSVGENIKLKL